MNAIIEKQYPVFTLYQKMRMQLLDAVTDEQLGLSLPNHPTLGELCVQIGEWQHSYVESFKTFKQDFEYRHPEAAELAGSTAKLRAWWQQLDADLEAAVSALSDEDIASKVVDKGGWEASLTWNLDILKECYIIFFTKAWVYLKAEGVDVPESWDHWVA